MANIRTASSEFGIGFPAERIMFKFKLPALALLFLAWTSRGSAQFAHTDQKQSWMAPANRFLFARQIWAIGWCLKATYGCYGSRLCVCATAST